MGHRQVFGSLHFLQPVHLRDKYFAFESLFEEVWVLVVAPKRQQHSVSSQQGEIAKSEAKYHSHFFQLEVGHDEVGAGGAMQQIHVMVWAQDSEFHVQQLARYCQQVCAHAL